MRLLFSKCMLSSIKIIFHQTYALIGADALYAVRICGIYLYFKIESTKKIVLGEKLS